MATNLSVPIEKHWQNPLHIGRIKVQCDCTLNRDLTEATELVNQRVVTKRGKGILFMPRVLHELTLQHSPSVLERLTQMSLVPSGRFLVK